LIKILVGVHDKRFESALVYVTEPNFVVVFLPAGRMSNSQPLHERSQIAVMFRPQNKMPMIGHQAVSQNSHVAFFKRFADNLFEGPVITVVKKQLLFSDAAIDNVIDKPTWGNA
jgi:hypothetical protein